MAESPKPAAEDHPIHGRASRQAAAAAIGAHVAVLKGAPLRSAIRDALAGAPKLGGKERRFVAFATRELSRHMRRLDLSAKAHGRSPSGFNLEEDRAIVRYAIWRHELTLAPPERVMVEVGLPGPTRPRSVPDAVIEKILRDEVTLDFGATPLEQAAARHSFPTWLAEAIDRSAPPGETEAVLAALNREPFLSLRARPPGTRDELIAALQKNNLKVVPCAELPDALRLDDDGRAIFDSRWMKEGRLQVMDLGSQLLAALCRLEPGQTAVDYCAGAGGKTLALADAVGPHGHVYAWDANPKRLKEAKSRTAELGLRHVSFPTEPRLDLADVVLIDAPCSGTGTLGREPDQKWKLNRKTIEELTSKQLGILEAVAPKLHPGAVIVYGTCSVLREEDEEIVERFLAKNPRFRLEGEVLRAWPHRLDGGGFFGARLRLI